MACRTPQRVALIVGHRPTAPGAKLPHLGVHEYPFNEEVAREAARILFQRGHTPQVFYRPDLAGVSNADEEDRIASVARATNAWGATATLSLRFNSVENPAAHGTEALYWHASGEGERLAREVLDHVKGLLGTRDRGAKPKQKGERGWPVLLYTASPCVLCEPFFGSSPSDCRRVAAAGQAALAYAYADAIEMWSKSDQA